MKARKVVAMILTSLGAMGLLAQLGQASSSGAHLIGGLIGGALGLLVFYRIIAGPEEEQAKEE